MNVPRWPTDRSTKAAVLAQFGRARADLMGWALTTGDPLADAVVEEIHAHGRPVREALQRGIAEGLSALTDPPPAVAALLAQCESLPDYVDDDLLDRGPLPYFAAPPPAHHLGVSSSLNRFIGILEICGALGLLIGLKLAWLGALAGIGLAALMIGATAMHMRAGNHRKAAVPAAVVLLTAAYVATRLISA
ncbi:DoxX family protein [Streptosporangium sp. CA-115845]|uniref:DoxX family protein n=1 Tax=Streptosporangium sp. CA-115845 TaxID=3240071 RepID=UPI003D91CBDC